MSIKTEADKCHDTLRRVYGRFERPKQDKGPGPIHDCCDETGHRVYHAVQFCRWTEHAKTCLAAARGEVSETAVKLRLLARDFGAYARSHYAAAMGKEVAA